MAKKKPEKNYKFLAWLIPLVIVLLIVVWFVGAYNGLVTADEGVNKAWGDVQSKYQRRADLIPNLIETVKGYKTYEKEVLENIVKLRSEAGQAKVQVDDATSPAQLENAMGSLDGVLSKLLVVVERYPDLKASQNFLALQDELAGTENRISVARDRYNAAVKLYNVKTRRFPTNIVANIFGFVQKEMFKAVEGAETVPEVKF